MKKQVPQLEAISVKDLVAVAKKVGNESSSNALSNVRTQELLSSAGNTSRRGAGF